MDEDLKMSEMTPRERKTKVPYEPEDWVALGVAILGLGALVVAVFATKAAPEKATTASTEAAAS
jgi:hydrogenase-4 membrane subunit HyfE